MNYLKTVIEELKEEKKTIKKSPIFAPAGQSTQVVIGASPEKDLQILQLAANLYGAQKLKRVYYSGYIPVTTDGPLSGVLRAPLLRENRLYQADWLMRFYGFKADEIVDEKNPDLALDVDPKLAYALRNPGHFPVDINRAPFEQILRVPGIGLKSAKMILESRRYGIVREEHLGKMGVALKRARWFIVTPGKSSGKPEVSPERIREKLIGAHVGNSNHGQLSLF